MPTHGQAVLTLCLLSIPFMFWGLGRYSIVNGDEAIYQEIALRMLASGDWFTLKSGGEHRIYDTFMNAPIQYWVRGIVAFFLGPSLWAMRIHSAFFGLLTALMLYRLVAHVADRQAAFLAGVIQMTTYQFLFLHGARTGELEMPMCFLFVLAAYLFIRAIEDPSRSFVPHHICFLLILNLKIPVVLIPALAELACFALSTKARARFVDWVKTGFLVLPFGLIWHVYQALQLGDAFFGVVEQMQGQATRTNRFGQSRTGLDNLTRYARVIVFGTFPYVLAYPLVMTGGLLARRGSDPAALAEESRWRTQLLVLVAYPAAVASFYLLIAKRGAWYPMPAYAFLSALLGIWLARLSRERIRDGQLAAIAISLSLFWWVAPEMKDFNPFAMPALAIKMRMRWWEPGFMEAALGVPLLAGLILAGLHLLRRGLAERFSRIFVVGLTSLLLLNAGLRASASLAYLDHQSDYALLRIEIDRKVAAGIALDYPILAPPGQAWIVRYYFWQEFVLRLAPPDPDAERGARRRYALYERRRIEEQDLPLPPYGARFNAPKSPAN